LEKCLQTAEGAALRDELSAQEAGHGKGKQKAESAAADSDLRL
jgi:hypothetical protein